MSKNLYLTRYAWQEELLPEYIPPETIEIIVVIPSFNEKDLASAVASLAVCNKPKGDVLILVIINESEDASVEISETNRQSQKALEDLTIPFDLLVQYVKLPNKKAGVGLARKVGMDEAVRLFEKVDKDGLIVCYDADCTCAPNYLTAIEEAFSSKQAKAGIVFYKHTLNGENKEAIINYELYLRYYIGALRFSGFPYAHQTLGSCIVVRSSIYQQAGGMNTRKAGEDFYFLNKVIPLGGFTEVNTTTIYPSDRVSDRVPFGTGKSVEKILDSTDIYTVYNPNCFEDLKLFYGSIKHFYQNSTADTTESIEAFLDGSCISDIERIREQTSTFATFESRFFHWFDAFKILKYVHFCRDNFYSSIPLEEALDWLAIHTKLNLPDDPEGKLRELRNADRGYLNEIK